jgi:hypothetical protein
MTTSSDIAGGCLFSPTGIKEIDEAFISKKVLVSPLWVYRGVQRSSKLAAWCSLPSTSFYCPSASGTGSPYYWSVILQVRARHNQIQDFEECSYRDHWPRLTNTSGNIHQHHQ